MQLQSRLRSEIVTLLYFLGVCLYLCAESNSVNGCKNLKHRQNGKRACRSAIKLFIDAAKFAAVSVRHAGEDRSFSSSGLLR